MQPQYRTMADVRRANAANGFHFFDASTLRFFASRIGRTLYGGRYFITSEQFISYSDPSYSGDRLYTVREVQPDGSIETVGEFQQYETNAQARAAIRNLLATN